MKKVTSLLLCCMAAAFPMSAQWTTLSNKAADGKELLNHVNNLAIDDGKLYAATPDGIWVSPSLKGGDWMRFGLEGENVLLLNFGEDKLALVDVPSVEYNKDGTLSTSGQIFKLNGSGEWENTNFNKELHKNYRATTGFVQIKDNNGKNVYVVPTWGDGIWRSEDSGETWNVCDYVADPISGLEVCKTVVGLFTFPGDNTIYGTDKADNDNNYLIRSTDYGKTWSIDWVGQFFNPWAFCKRNVNGVETFFFGGENGSNGYTVMKSTEGGAENTWDICSTTDGVGTYWHNRYMLASDDAPMFVMCAATGVFAYNDDDASLIMVGDNLNVNKENTKSLTHLAKSGKTLYCSSQEYFIQSYDISDLEINGVEGIYDDSENNVRLVEGNIYVPADSGTTISVYSMLGVKVFNVAANGPETVVSASTLNAGIYFVEYLSAGQHNATKIYIR